ncbi:MAG TPA: ubiquitin-like domain-containing protein [Candidatus Nanoarchaeia archaeon]|nr:ubiquitin-like domain-containing protein [Candidatus Nanoarchaeia archaeon]
MALAFTSGSLVTDIPPAKSVLADSAKVVNLYYDGQKKTLATDATTPREVLKRAGINFGDNDLTDPPADSTLPAGLSNINVFRAQPVIIYDGANAIRTYSAYKAPRLIVENAGVKLYPEDVVSSQVVTDFVTDQLIGLRLDVKRALPVTLIADGHTLSLRSQAKTVNDLLVEHHIALGEKDTVTPALDSQIKSGEQVAIVRVAEAVITKEEVLQRPTKTENDPTQAKGVTKVKSEGSDGHRTVTYRIHYRNGIETGRETLDVQGQVDPKPKVVLVGTKVFFPGNIEYWRPLVQEAADANGVDPNLMLAIMRCESNGNATATNGIAFGLYQYLPSTWANSGGTRDNIYDGALQINVTAKKIASYGTSAWNASKYCWGGSY